ncbi:hypothetical protein Tco_0357310 [Tanacetum coccineum]
MPSEFPFGRVKALKISLSKKRRLVAELEALVERDDATSPLEHMREIVAHDSGTIWKNFWRVLSCPDFGYREYDLAHLKLIFEFSIYKVWKSVGYGVMQAQDMPYLLDLDTRIVFRIDNPSQYHHLSYQNAQEKALSRGETFNWQFATYSKMEYCEDEDDCFTNFETKFPAIVLDNTLKSDATISCGPTVSPLNENGIDFRISFDESNNEDYTVVYDENSFSYKIISVNNLKMDSENDNDKVNMPSFPSLEHEVSYFNNLDFFKDFENEFLAIVYNDALTSKLDLLTEPTISPRRIEIIF